MFTYQDILETKNWGKTLTRIQVGLCLFFFEYITLSCESLVIITISAYWWLIVLHVGVFVHAQVSWNSFMQAKHFSHSGGCSPLSMAELIILGMKLVMLIVNMVWISLVYPETDYFYFRRGCTVKHIILAHTMCCLDIVPYSWPLIGSAISFHWTFLHSLVVSVPPPGLFFVPSVSCLGSPFSQPLTFSSALGSCHHPILSFVFTLQASCNV